MNKKSLKVGDRIRIVSPPKGAMHSDTKQAYLKLISRGRPVRIYSVDEYGQPWFHFRLKGDDGTWEHHWMCVMDGDDNWVRVKPRANRGQ